MDKISIKEGRRGLDKAYVEELAGSIRELGLLNPVTVDKNCRLIAGLHRLEEVKRSGLRRMVFHPGYIRKGQSFL